MTRKPVRVLIGMIGLLVAAGAGATVEAVPPADAIKQVVDYYYHGQNEGPVLVEAKVCKTVHKLECKTEMDTESVPKGETVNVWMQFFVPEDAVYDDIMIEYTHEGVPRRLIPYSIKGSIRYRVVDQYKLNKTGSWEITIKKGTQGLKTFALEVVEQ